MWVKIEKRAEKSDIYFKNEDVTKVSIRLDEYAKDHDILACWELGLSLRGEDILFKYFNTKEEAEEWMRENIFYHIDEYDDEVGDAWARSIDLKLALKYGNYTDQGKLDVIRDSIRMLEEARDEITRKELGRR